MYSLVQNTHTLTVKPICRYIFTDSIKYSISRQSRFMKKFIIRSESKGDPVTGIINSHIYQSPKTQLSVHTIRRMNVLNKVFMEHITDLMSTGEIEPKILDRNIEISHVKVTPDFKLINVFWIDHNLQESDTEELLKKCTFQLRHELSQLRVIGNVPPVQFVKCKGIAKLKEVERKLNALDFDAEHVSTPYPNDIHHIVTAKILVNNKEIESVKNGSENSFSVSVPMMKHNVFGLDHYRIMTKIKASLNKTRKNRKEQAINVDSKHSSKLNVDKVPSFITEKEQEEQFKEFLVQKRKQQRFMLKKRRSRKNDFIYDLEEQNDNDFYDYTLNNKHDDFDDIQDDDDFDEYVDKEFDKKH